ncbi:hypothetical protein [Streptomyces sp. NPDC019507]|uniref:hypothetical protein n=1 Tax=Streptomyces sp. NPDC019507 TaxID=3154689 RepID=UPI0033D3BBA5
MQSKIVLVSDPRVAAITVQDCGEELIDTRASGLSLVDGRQQAAMATTRIGRRRSVAACSTVRREPAGPARFPGDGDHRGSRKPAWADAGYLGGAERWFRDRRWAHRSSDPRLNLLIERTSLFD